MQKKVILVTGGSSGIGKSICQYLTSKGYIVYGTSRKLQQELEFPLLSIDVTDEQSVKNGIQELLQKEGRIDVLINNAGIGMMGAIEDSVAKDSLKVFETNVFGPLRTMQTVLPTMRSQRSGLIINIGSIAGYMGLPYRGIYSATKASLGMITEALRMELRPYNIQACVLDPGDYSTSIAQHRQVSIPDHSPYKSNVVALEKMIDEEVHSSSDPLEVARLIEKIIQTPRPKVRYLSGKRMQKISVALKQCIGGKFFERILIKHYKL
ncbi:MAG TPA: SDR family oxidoreductase [Cytophagaceae bacterium]|jgi:short-subunit dehydrogenase|nr:SDR family oxidoreductase [Cytophagaceae bacterium]